MTPNPLMLYGGVALAVIAFGAGWTVRDWRCDAAQTAALERAAKAEDEAENVVAESASVYEEDRAALAQVVTNERVTVREIYRDIEVPSDCAVDPAAVGVLAGARERANAAAAGELGAVLPEVSASP